MPPGIRAERSYTFAPKTLLHLKSTDGAVRVYPSETASVIQIEARIRTYVTTAAQLPDAESYVESLVAIRESDESLYIVTEPEDRPDFVDLHVHYRITLPLGMNVIVEVDNGNVRVGEGCNQVTIDGNNTDVDVQYPEGRSSVKTINGRINVVGCKDDAFLETVNGSIITSLFKGSIQASTVTGSITTTLLDQKIHSCDLTSLNGSITLVLPELMSVNVHASTEQGAIRSDPALLPARTVERRREILGSLGNGETKISLHSMNGDVILQRSVL